MKPRILISRSPETSGLYEAAVEKAGGEPLSFHCPDIEMEFDALILAGGGDVDPRVFMERNLGSYDIDFPRDQAEIALVNRCIYENKPISRVNKVRRCRKRACKICVSYNLKRLHCSFIMIFKTFSCKHF